MSDETTADLSPLRLKPRLRIPSEGGVEVATAVTAQASVPEPAIEQTPVVEAPAPAIRFKPRVPAAPPASVVVAPELVGSAVATPAVIGEPPKFKFKSKGADAAATSESKLANPGAQLIGAIPPSAPMVFPLSEPTPAPAASTAAGSVPRSTVPPFPVVAGPAGSRTNPSIPVPHIKVKVQAEPELEPFEDQESRRKGARRLVWLLVFAALGAGGYFGWPYLKPLVERFTKAKAGANPPTSNSNPGLTPSDTLNKLAHAPAAAIDKAQEAIAARRASGQTRVEAALTGQEIPEKTKAVASPAAVKSKPAVPPPPVTMMPVTRGLAASVQLEAAADASPEFRNFVANARVSGVFQGAPPRAMINGKLTRAGETADPALGVIFEGLDTEKKQLIFRDRSGAIISRRY